MTGPRERDEVAEQLRSFGKWLQEEGYQAITRAPHSGRPGPRTQRLRAAPPDAKRPEQAIAARNLRRRRGDGTPGWSIIAFAVVASVTSVMAANTALYPGSANDLAIATSPLDFDDGPHGASSFNADGNGGTVTATTAKVRKEVPIYGCDPSTSPASQCVLTINVGSFASVTGQQARLNVGLYDGSPTFYFEATLLANSGGTVSARLTELTGTSVGGSQVDSTDSSAYVLVRSGSITLTGNKDYTFQVQRTGSGNALLTQAKIIIEQTVPTRTSTQVLLSGGDQTTSTSTVLVDRSSRFLYTASDWDPTPTFTFEAVAHLTSISLSGNVRLWDATTGSSVVALGYSGTGITYSSAGATLVDGREYEVRMERGSGLGSIELFNARLRLDQATGGSNPIGKTVSYVEVQRSEGTSSTTMTSTGNIGRVLMESEWGTREAYLEATFDVSGGNAAAVELVHDGTATAVANSLVSGPSGISRARSSAFILDELDADYRPTFNRTTGGGGIEVHGIWIIIHQPAGKLFDHIIELDPDPDCATGWAFHMEHAGSNSNLGRLDDANVTLKLDDTWQEQIVVSGGSVTTTSGTAVTVASGDVLEFVVFSNPNATGTSSFAARLVGVCDGVRTVEDLTIEFQ